MVADLPDLQSLPGASRLIEQLQSEALKRLDPDLNPLRVAVGRTIAKHPLVPRHQLVDAITRYNRVRATQGAAYSLFAAVPGLGTAAGVATLGPGLGKLLTESAVVSAKIALLYDRELEPAQLRQAAILGVLSHPARASSVWGDYGYVVVGRSGFEELLEFRSTQFDDILSSGEAVIGKWAAWVGGPFIVGLAPWGIGAFAAVNWIQHVMKDTIRSASRFFEPTDSGSI